jgi:hypothetical protein
MIWIEPDFDNAPTELVCTNCEYEAKYMLPLPEVELGNCPDCGESLKAAPRDEYSLPHEQSTFEDFDM